MNCPKCEGCTRVRDYCPSDAPDTKKGLRATGERFLGWYSRDWRVRVRGCTVCGYTFRTLEIPAEDIKGICEDPPPLAVFKNPNDDEWID